MIPRADKKNKENNEDQKRESMRSDTISLGGGEGGVAWELLYCTRVLLYASVYNMYYYAKEKGERERKITEMSSRRKDCK
jgi:hypothetical protein